MKVSISSDNLKRMTSLMARSADSGKISEILSMVRIQADAENNKIKMISTNASVGQVITGSAEVEEAGDVLVSADFLAKTISKMAGQTVDMQLRNDSLIVKSGSARFSLPISNSLADYPNVEASFGPSQVRMPTEILVTMMNRTVVATAINHNTPVLTGVYFEYDGMTLKLTSTDSTSLAHVTYDVEGDAFGQSVIVPSPSVKDLARLLSAYSPEYVELGASENFFYARFDGVAFLSRVIEGQYPQYQPLLTQDEDSKLIVTTDIFKDMLDRSTLMRTTDAPVLVLESVENKLKAQSQASTKGTFEEYCDLLDGSGTLEYPIGLNPTVLLRTINTIPKDTESISLSFNGPLRPIVVKYESEVLSRDDFILMPLRLAG